MIGQLSCNGAIWLALEYGKMWMFFPAKATPKRTVHLAENPSVLAPLLCNVVILLAFQMHRRLLNKCLLLFSKATNMLIIDSEEHDD